MWIWFKSDTEQEKNTLQQTKGLLKRSLLLMWSPHHALVWVRMCEICVDHSHMGQVYSNFSPQACMLYEVTICSCECDKFDSNSDIKIDSITFSLLLNFRITVIYLWNKIKKVFVIYLSCHARLHAGPHARVASRVLHLHAHALPCLIHELRRDKSNLLPPLFTDK